MRCKIVFYYVKFFFIVSSSVSPGEFLSMGYGFVEYKTQAGAQKALKELQYADLDGHQVALKVSNRVTL